MDQVRRAVTEEMDVVTVVRFREALSAPLRADDIMMEVDELEFDTRQLGQNIAGRLTCKEDIAFPAARSADVTNPRSFCQCAHGCCVDIFSLARRG